MTYTTGMNTSTIFNRVCPINFYELSDTKTLMTLINGGTMYDGIETQQACSWKIENPLRKDNYILDLSEVTVVLEYDINADVFIFVGQNRGEAINIVEQGDKLYPGNPLRLSTNLDFYIVFIKSVDGIESNGSYTSYSGSFSLSYEVSGKKHPFWEVPFLLLPRALWYITLISVLIAIGSCIYFFCVRPCCLKKPICPCSDPAWKVDIDKDSKGDKDD